MLLLLLLLIHSSDFLLCVCLLSVPLSFVYPPLFYMKLKPNAPFFEKVVDSTVVLIGLLTFFYVTYSNLKQWVA